MNGLWWNQFRWPIATAAGFGMGWVITHLLGLPGDLAWIVRMFCAAIGAGLLAAFEARRQTPRAPGATGGDPLWEARRRWTGKDPRQGEFLGLPAVFILGGSGSAKTSTVMNSALDAELLSGAVFQDGRVAPTADLNVWVARRTGWIEAGGATAADPGRWQGFCRAIRKGRTWRAWAGGTQAPRAALLCVDLERFLTPGAAARVEQDAREWQARLRELAAATGAHLPVYVLFTRADRLPYFAEYFGSLTEDEARQPFGATLPELPLEAGVYSERQAARAGEELNILFHRLADVRRTSLGRENDERKWPAVYEFPREFRKLKPLVTSFLVEAFRPSQVQESAVPRGFYFSGVRPVEIRQEPVTPRSAQQWGEPGREATDLFGARERASAWGQMAAMQGSASRRAPGWLFLPGLFHDVILADSFAGKAAAGGSSRRRRALAIGACAVSAVLAALFTGSYTLNRGAISKVENAASSIGGSRFGPGQAVPAAPLQRVEELRDSLATLRRRLRDGAPFFQRWGLDQTAPLLEAARPVYFRKFDAVQRDAVHQNILGHLRQLPVSPGPKDEYGVTYDALKSYLIMTSHPDKSTRAFLGPALLRRWTSGWTPDSEAAALGQRQFDFYADELPLGNPFSASNDSAAIERARRYLAAFGAAERIYQAMLAETDRKAPILNFNKMFPGSGQAVINNRDIRGAFSNEGWMLMQEAVRHVDRFMQGEEWVLGPQAFAKLSPAALERELWQRYVADFSGQWRQYLRQSAVVGYAGPADAARKLGLISGNQSPLLRLFCLASLHTAAAKDGLKDAFQPVQYTTPAGCENQLPSVNNQPYLSGLLGLQAALEQIGGNGPTEMQINRVSMEADSARRAARQLGQNFRPDAEGDVDRQTQRLLEEPITRVAGLVGAMGPARINGEAAKLCSDARGLLNKYPFNTSSKVDASIEELNGVFRPGSGSLWVFYDNHLRAIVTRQGPEYVASGSGTVRVTPDFLRFFNRAAAFSDALYGAARAEPRLDFTLKAMPSDGVRGLTILLDGQSLQSAGTGGASKSFRWPGSPNEARLSANLGGSDLGLLQYGGLFAVFRLFGDADRWRPSGGGYEFNWQPRQGQSNQPMTTADGKPLTIQYLADFGSSAPIFAKGYLSGFSCTALAAR